METDQKEGVAEAEPSKNQDAGGEGSEGAKEKARAPEALSYRLDNPSRVTPAQQKFVVYEEASRWRPIHASRFVTGIIVLKDLQPGACRACTSKKCA